jgi:hypothetical protein
MSDRLTRLYETLAMFTQAHLLIEAEIAEYGETWALADANAMAVDAASQIRGELNTIISGELRAITAIVITGEAA